MLLSGSTPSRSRRIRPYCLDVRDVLRDLGDRVERVRRRQRRAEGRRLDRRLDAVDRPSGPGRPSRRRNRPCGRARRSTGAAPARPRTGRPGSASALRRLAPSGPPASPPAGRDRPGRRGAGSASPPRAPGSPGPAARPMDVGPDAACSACVVVPVTRRRGRRGRFRGVLRHGRYSLLARGPNGSSVQITILRPERWPPQANPAGRSPLGVTTSGPARCGRAAQDLECPDFRARAGVVQSRGVGS